MNDKVAFFKLDEGAESHAVKPAAAKPPTPAPAARAAAKVPAKPPAKREAAPARKPASAAIAAAAVNGRRGGPVGRMQAAVATAMAEDTDWKEF
jgi:ferric-dicitrate binding protein FerR (iron transport regulator)